MKRHPNIDKIITFREVLGWISYDLDHHYSLNRDKRGSFYVNKLYIEPEYLTYKTECAELEKGLFEKVEKLWELLQGDKSE